MRNETRAENERMESDIEVREMLTALGGEPPMEEMDWRQLRRRIGAAAAPTLAAQRARMRRTRTALGGLALAASSAALLLLPAAPRAPAGPAGSAPEGPVGAQPGGNPMTAGGITLDELFDADLSDEEFRALLEGGADVDALLMIAAEEGEL